MLLWKDISWVYPAFFELESVMVVLHTCPNSTLQLDFSNMVCIRLTSATAAA